MYPYLGDNMKLGIYMGSFNPVHKGHLKVVNYLLDNSIIDKVLIVPTLSYWNKTNLVCIKHRINMLKLFENKNIIIDTKHNNLIYTIDLVKEIEKLYPSDELFIIIGSDNIVDFDKWKDYKELLKYKIIVMNRDNMDVNPYVDKLGNENFIILNNFPFIKASSSEIRNNLNNKYLDNKVLDYIKENHLYGL